ncbi:MAG: cupin domain-containing protein [Lachnospiraceae bacterium]
MNQCEWQVLRNKISCKIFHGDDMTIQYAEVHPGATLKCHSHPYEQIIMILQGECDFFVDGIAYPMVSGSIMQVPPMLEHGILAKGDVPVINVDIFHPKREDRQESVETL